ncbi:MAG: glycosyltransferase family 2 protein [Paludibacteraceae bacterium]|nr:glycosyltransferase family 2 protein [Paludibacteraceae bacterium]
MIISVIIPLYNKIRFVEQTLQSIFAQTYQDYEIIIINDGSTDGSAELVERLIDGHHNCKLIHQANAGVGVARNNGVNASNGEYLCFLDADDWWEPTFIEEMASFSNEYPDAGLWACNYIYYKPGKTHIGVKHPTGYINYPKCYFKNEGMPVWTGAVMMQRKVFDEMGGFPVDIKLGEDFLLWSKIAHHYKIAFLDKALSYYNNDIQPSLRATRNLHSPYNNMLWHVDDLITDNDWRLLIDKLRVNGLLEYWLSKEYHNIAKIELDKVDWSKQQKCIIKLYNSPIWFLKAKGYVMKLGSTTKHLIIRFIISIKQTNNTVAIQNNASFNTMGNIK